MGAISKDQKGPGKGQSGFISAFRRAHVPQLPQDSLVLVSSSSLLPPAPGSVFTERRPAAPARINHLRGARVLLWTVCNPGRRLLKFFEQPPTPPSFSKKPGWLPLHKRQGCRSSRYLSGHRFLTAEAVSGHGAPSKPQGTETHSRHLPTSSVKSADSRKAQRGWKQIPNSLLSWDTTRPAPSSPEP